MTEMQKMRKKINLAYITNDSERKASYNKRKKGLIKKVSELSTLCGVDACAIIYSQYDPEPVVWPSHEQAHDTLARFHNLSEMDQGRKMVNQESFTRQRIKKAADQLRRLQRENMCRELECYMYQCIAGTGTLDKPHFSDAAEMNWVINQTLHNIQSRQDALMAKSNRRQALLPPPSVEVPKLPQLPPLPPPLPPVPSLSTDVLMPRMEEDNLKGFPWNVEQIPTTGPEGNAAGLDDSDIGWNAGTMQSYPYILNLPTSDQQGNQWIDFNNSNNPNSFNYFKYFHN